MSTPSAKSLTFVATLSLVALSAQAMGPAVQARKGKLEGSYSWTLPDAGGMKPSHSWHAIGGVPDGDLIFIGGMDHLTNSALYMINVKNRTLNVLGDAKSASNDPSVKNWAADETMEKFHSRPSYYAGKVYVVGLDRSYPNEEYKNRYGLHWYSYDIATDKFADISSAEFGKTALPKGSGGVRNFWVDEKSNKLVGILVPTMEVVTYDIATKVTTKFGKPPQMSGLNQFYIPGFTWMDTRGNFYLNSGNYNGPYPEAIYGKLYSWNSKATATPTQAFTELPNFKLQTDAFYHGNFNGGDIAYPNAIETGQCVLNNTICIVASDRTHTYLFEDEGPKWTYLGHPTNMGNYTGTWYMQASLDGRKAYFITARPGNEVWELDVASKTWTKLGNTSDFDPEMNHNEHSGYNAWDADGCMYVVSFGSNDYKENVVVTRLDIVRAKVALKKLPELVQVTLEKSTTGYVLSRSGSTSAAQPVLLGIKYKDNAGFNAYKHFIKSIPAGSANLNLALDEVANSTTGLLSPSNIFVVNAGSDYVAGSAASVPLTPSNAVINSKIHNQHKFSFRLKSQNRTVNGRKQ